MARDSMQPWLDRLSYGELEVSGLSARSALGSRDWDGTEASIVSRSFARPANPDISALPVTVSPEVGEDTAGGYDDLDFTVASY
ncbi:hypothetical protein [Pyxidicoccus sp. MSG2]|uniref:hypothetical protein n=1 Tax=Pyxidicoccus sp. MSG2 TaxID=2996790 RepID=UPI0022707637|nr:hypothetical protein [Pyxidicoccus sp. MSG2]MCY1015551.1 hypothetical protein [Pyxidicoccus sp. MSG2]